MRFVSTRGQAPVLGFADAVLAGLATDGGLYVPESWPTAPAEVSADYATLATDVMLPFAEADVDRDTLYRLCSEAYSTFRDPRVTPLAPLESGHWMLELFHGPTLAFKDVALQFLGRLFDHLLEARDESITIVGATSVEQLEESLASAELILDAATLKRIDEIDEAIPCPMKEDGLRRL